MDKRGGRRVFRPISSCLREPLGRKTSWTKDFAVVLRRTAGFPPALGMRMAPAGTDFRVNRASADNLREGLEWDDNSYASPNRTTNLSLFSSRIWSTIRFANVPATNVETTGAVSAYTVRRQHWRECGSPFETPPPRCKGGEVSPVSAPAKDREIDNCRVHRIPYPDEYDSY